MAEQLPIKIEVPTRSVLVQRYKDLRKIRNPSIDTSEGTEVDIDARVMADALNTLYAAAANISGNSVVSSAQGGAIREWGNIEGVEQGQATGSSGFVQITSSSGGGRIFVGDILFQKSNPGGPRYQCTQEKQYKSLDHVPIAAVDFGRETNLAGGTVMVWSSPRPGIGPNCTVATREDGSGLSGGAAVPSNESYRQSIINKKRNPTGGGNDNQYQQAIKNAPGVPVEAAFTYPAILGPGNKSIAFTVMPSRPGGSRVPTGDQVELVRQHVESEFGADDSVLASSLAEHPVTVVYTVKWASGNWVDSAPFPLYRSTSAGGVTVQSVTDALNFVLKRTDNVYAGREAPVAGQTIAFWDNGKVTGSSKWRAKRILTVTGTGPWTIVCDVTNRASDETYVPVVTQRVSPWATSMTLLEERLASITDQMGPGEQVMNAEQYPDGVRRRRSPKAPASWPHVLTNAMLEGVLDPSLGSALSDRNVVEGGQTVTPTGIPGVLSSILSLSDVSIHPL